MKNLILLLMVIPLISFNNIEKSTSSTYGIVEDVLNNEPYDEGYKEGWQDGVEDVLRVKVSWNERIGINYTPYHRGYKSYKDGYKQGFKDGTAYGKKYPRIR